MPAIVTDAVRAELAPTGKLRAGINLSNFLLVSSRTAAGEPVGVSPDMARAVAERLGVELVYVPFDRPGQLADAADANVWDVGLIGAEPKRAEKIDFTPAYVEIEATYLVPPGSPIRTLDEVDRPGIRIAVSERAAYDLYLSRHLKHAELVRIDGIDPAFRYFMAHGLEALAGLRTGLMDNADEMKGARVLDGRFSTVQQAIGTPKPNKAGHAFLCDFVAEAKASGFIASLLDKHKPRGLTVAP